MSSRIAAAAGEGSPSPESESSGSSRSSSRSRGSASFEDGLNASRGSAHGGADEDARRGVRGVFANVAVASSGGVVFAVVAGSVEPRWEVGERVVGVHLRDVVVHALVLVDGLTGKGHVLVEARGRLAAARVAASDGVSSLGTPDEGSGTGP